MDLIQKLKEKWPENFIFVIKFYENSHSEDVAKLFIEAFGKSNVYGLLLPNGEDHNIETYIKSCVNLGISYDTINIAVCAPEATTPLNIKRQAIAERIWGNTPNVYIVDNDKFKELVTQWE